MRKIKVPQKILSIDNGINIRCLVKKKYSISDMKKGLLKSLDISIKNNKLFLSDNPVVPLSIGKFSDQNRNGLIIKRKDLPKETVYYTQDRTITDWHRNEHDVIISMPYKKYPRETIPAQKIKVKSYLIDKNNDDFEFGFVFDRIIIKGNKNWKNDLLFLMNLSLELFSEFDLINTDTNISLIKTIKTNWQILPAGEYPFERIKEQIKKEIQKSKISLDQFDLKRLDFFESLSPDFRAIGTNEFRGYVIFGFKSKKIYILDNSRIGNAIYIFNNQWKNYSQKTKKELIDMINSDQQIKRIVHNDNWQQKIKKILYSLI